MNPQTQLTSTPRSLQPPATPIVDWCVLERFVVTEEDFRTASDNMDASNFNPNTQCLVATALSRIGYPVERCGYSAIAVSGVWREASRETTDLVRAFIHRRKRVSDCLPFVVELKDGSWPLTKEAESVLAPNDNI